MLEIPKESEHLESQPLLGFITDAVRNLRMQTYEWAQEWSDAKQDHYLQDPDEYLLSWRDLVYNNDLTLRPTAKRKRRLPSTRSQVLQFQHLL